MSYNQPLKFPNGRKDTPPSIEDVESVFPAYGTHRGPRNLD